MGKQWDGGDIAFRPETWRLCWDLLPPGGHLLAFSGTRTYHRMACAIEDAGFEIRDMVADLVASDTAVQAFLASLNEEQRAAFLRCIAESGFGGMLAWLYGTGFPKSHDQAKAFDRAAGIDVQAAGWQPTTPAAVEWQGWGTALKPALEPICFARKPLEGSVHEGMARHRVGAINVDGCRVETSDILSGSGSAPLKHGGENSRPFHAVAVPRGCNQSPGGRWPANVVCDGSDEVIEAFPASPGQRAAVSGEQRAHGSLHALGTFGASKHGAQPRGDDGSAARFFYSAKADAGDRLGSKHPTVKRVDLMRWLVRLVTPPGGTVLDPFAGSGTTGMACLAEGFDAVLVERDPEYAADIRRRIAHVSGADTPLFGGGNG